MAGNNSIQILRTTRINAYEHRDDANTLPGQPIYITDDNQLAIGGLDGNEGVPLPIGATSLHGYTSDITNGKISTPTSILQYNIAYNTSMSAMCYASGKHVFSGIGTPPWMNVTSSEITLNTISSINSVSSMQLRAVSGAYMVTGTSQLGTTPQNAYVIASNFYIRGNSTTTQGNIIEITGNGVTANTIIGQNAVGNVTLRGSMLTTNFITAATIYGTAVSMCTSKSKVMQNSLGGVEIYASSDLMLRSNGNIQILANQQSSGTADVTIEGQNVNISALMMNIAANLSGITIYGNITARGGLTVMPDGTSSYIRFPSDVSGNSIVRVSGSLLRSIAIPSQYYSGFTVSDTYAPISNESTVGGVSAWRYYHMIHIDGAIAGNELNCYFTSLMSRGTSVSNLSHLSSLSRPIPAGGIYTSSHGTPWQVVAIEGGLSNTTIYYM